MGHPPLPNPAAPTKIRRFRANPVELAIFSVITLIFFNSIYSLLYDQHGFHPTALAPMAANPVSEGRYPASVSQAFVNFEVRCDSNSDRDTQATKVRLTGPLCPGNTENDVSKLVKALVVNNSNKFNATVFTDVGTGKFSTDYIPLSVGTNAIHIEFSYNSGSVVTQDFKVVKN